MEHINPWDGVYYGSLRLSGHCIEDVFDIGDRQKINRIRDRNGGEFLLQWMRWSDRQHMKLSDRVLCWLEENNINMSAVMWTNVRMTPEQAMNYFERQKRESYPGKKISQVISQYEDYMNGVSSKVCWYARSR